MYNFFQRLDKFIKLNGLNDNKITVASGISNGLIGKARHRGALSQINISKILLTYPELNADWLLTSRGDMLNKQIKKGRTKLSEKNLLKNTTQIDDLINPKSQFNNLELKLNEIIAPKIKNSDYVVEITNNNMFPKYKIGDIIVCKKIDLQNIFFQQDYFYALETKQGFMIKKIKKSLKLNCMILENEDQNLDGLEIEISEINSIAVVQNVIKID